MYPGCALLIADALPGFVDFKDKKILGVLKLRKY
jgi:hypothetical protein